jgi:hypothetical protein
MVHIVEKIDKRDYGKHTTYCGTILKMNETKNICFSIYDATCPICKQKKLTELINQQNTIIDSINKILSNINNQILLNSYQSKLIKEQNKLNTYVSLLNNIKY